LQSALVRTVVDFNSWQGSSAKRTELARQCLIKPDRRTHGACSKSMTNPPRKKQRGPEACPLALWRDGDKEPLPRLLPDPYHTFFPNDFTCPEIVEDQRRLAAAAEKLREEKAEARRAKRQKKKEEAANRVQASRDDAEVPGEALALQDQFAAKRVRGVNARDVAQATEKEEAAKAARASREDAREASANKKLQQAIRTAFGGITSGSTPRCLVV
jgi:hypothetical protein